MPRCDYPVWFTATPGHKTQAALWHADRVCSFTISTICGGALFVFIFLVEDIVFIIHVVIFEIIIEIIIGIEVVIFVILVLILIIVEIVILLMPIFCPCGLFKI